MHLKYMIFGLMIWLAWPLCSQYQLGMRLERNAGVYGIILNPTQNVYNPHKWDIQIASTGFFLENNYLFLKETNLSRLMRNRNDLTVVENKTSNRANVFEIGFNDNSASRFFHSKLFFSGPAIGFQYDHNHSFGIYFQARPGLSVTNIPNEFSYRKITNRRRFDPFSASPTSGVFVNLLETGLNYSYTKSYNFSDQISLGINLKYLRGYDMLYASSRRKYNHSIIGPNDFEMARPHIAFGYSALESDYNDLHGHGGGIDVGISYAKNLKKNDYDYKIGISLIDLGTVNFKTGITTYEFISDSTIQIIGKDYETLSPSDEIQDLVNIFLQNSIGNKPELTTGNKQNIMLPFTISAQIDYKIQKSWYVNAVLVQSVSLSDTQLKGVQIVAITPRYEHKWYSVSLPTSLIEVKNFRIGLGARLGYLSLGCDNLLSIFGRSNFYGTDFYAGIKIGFGQRTSGRSKRTSDDDCFTF